MMSINNDYGKLDKTNNLTLAPYDIIHNNTKYIPGTAEVYLAEGYHHITRVPMPDDGNNYSSGWKLKNGEIIQTWTLVPDTRTPAEKREDAYQTRLCVVYPKDSNSLITVDAAVKLVSEYSCETTDRAIDIVSYLKSEITDKKAAIREEFPDVIPEGN